MSEEAQTENVSNESESAPQGPAKPEPARRERSTIEFPYVNLEDAEEAAQAIFREAGVTEITINQVAHILQMSPASSGFRVRLSGLRLFGLVEGDSQHLSLTALGRDLAEAHTAAAARVAAFLRVPLYRLVAENHDGHTLPQAAPLQRELIQLGVAPKMAERARQILERSARHAGFTRAGSDRFVLPIVQQRHEPREAAPAQDEPSGQPGGGSGSGGDGLDPVIRALVAKIPPAGTQWPLEEQVQLLQMLAMAFHMTYKNKRPITVSTSSMATALIDGFQRSEGIPS